jgi:hypothetical protein
MSRNLRRAIIGPDGKRIFPEMTVKHYGNTGRPSKPPAK